MYSCEIQIEHENPEFCRIIKQTLEVEKEICGTVSKILKNDKNIFFVYFKKKI